MGVIFDIESRPLIVVMYEVQLKWIIVNDVGYINMLKYLNNKNIISAGFSQRSSGVLMGAIGALDSWLLYII